MKNLILALSITGIWATGATADGAWIVGAGLSAGQSPYVGDKDEASLFPYIAFETERLHIGVDGLSYNLLNNGGLSVDVTLDPRFAPDFPGTDLFAGLERDDALELGFDATYWFGAAYAGLSFAHDVTDAHEGYEGSASVGYELELGQLGMNAAAGVKFRDANLNNYLFGVSDDEATATRAAFDVGDTTTAFASLSAIYPLSDQMFLLGEVTVEDLGNAAKSPLVDEERIADITIGVGFQF